MRESITLAGETPRFLCDATPPTYCYAGADAIAGRLPMGAIDLRLTLIL
jgi:hypothetical protein